MIILIKQGSTFRRELVCATPTARDDGRVQSIANQRDVGLVLRHDDEFLVQTSLDVDGERLVAVGRRDGDGSGHGGVGTAAIRGHHQVGGLLG